MITDPSRVLVGPAALFWTTEATSKAEKRKRRNFIRYSPLWFGPGHPRPLAIDGRAYRHRTRKRKR